MVFDQNTLAGEWLEQVRRCEEQDIALDRDIAFALAVADLLELPPAVVTCSPNGGPGALTDRPPSSILLQNLRCSSCGESSCSAGSRSGKPGT